MRVTTILHVASTHKMHRTSKTTMTARMRTDDGSNSAVAGLARSLIASFTAKLECTDDASAKMMMMTIPCRDFVVKHMELSSRLQDLGKEKCSRKSRLDPRNLARKPQHPSTLSRSCRDFIGRFYCPSYTGMTSSSISPFSEGCKY